MKSHSSATSEDLRVAVDVGGTFTDCVVQRQAQGWLYAKAQTTPDDRGKGVIESLRAAAREMGVDFADFLRRIRVFVHGSTVGTNTLVERKGTRTGLLMTAGHEQALTIGRARQKVAGLNERERTRLVHLKKPEPPLVLPEDICGIPQRMDRNGVVIRPLDIDASMRMVDRLVERGVGSLAVCLLWSFANPAHEKLLAQSIAERHPKLYVSLSSQVAPVIGEYERCASTALNAYVGPEVSSYLASLEHRLNDLGMKAPLLLMLGNGGVSSIRSVTSTPILTLDSGPAGGVLGAMAALDRVGESNVICADVGGTTFDTGLVFRGEIQADPSPVIDQYDYHLDKTYIRSIGAGGGSIAWTDHLGGLRVGPMSAGADPGPAFYGRGGTCPTLADACLLLGYLNPDYFLGGRMRVDTAAARAACEPLAAELGMSVAELALGIVRIASAQMADLLRKVTIERGFDPREFSVFAYGGAGPMFAGLLARDVGAKAAFVMPESSVFSAAGMLRGKIRFAAERSLLVRPPITQAHVESINALYAALDDQVRSEARRDSYRLAAGDIHHFATVRFTTQHHQLVVGVPWRSLTLQFVRELEQDFISQYRRIYGAESTFPGAPVELTSFRSVGALAQEGAGDAAPSECQQAHDAGPSPTEIRDVLFPGAGNAYRTPVFRVKGSLPSGMRHPGPLIVERPSDTVVIPPGCRLEVRSEGIMVILSEDVS